MTERPTLDAVRRRITHVQAIIDSITDNLDDTDPDRDALLRAQGLLEQAEDELGQLQSDHLDNNG